MDDSKKQEKDLRISMQVEMEDKKAEASDLARKARELFKEATMIREKLEDDGKEIDVEELQSLEAFESEEEEDEEKLSKALSSIRFSQVTKLKKFKRGENFSMWCDRFVEYVHITKMKDENLYMFLLQNVCDQTYSVLQTVELTKSQKRNAKEFCRLYKAAIYGDEEIALKNELMSCQQKVGESIEEYAFRLREKAHIAYLDKSVGEENCLLALLRGVRDIEMRKKLNEASFRNFTDAVRQAKKIESVSKMLRGSNYNEGVTSIMKQNTVEDNEKSEQGPGNFTKPSSLSERNSNSRQEFSEVERSRPRGRQEYTNFGGGYRSSSRPNRGRQFRRQGDSNMVCWLCSRRGHRQANCWQANSINRNSGNYRGDAATNFGENFYQNSYSRSNFAQRDRRGNENYWNNGRNRVSNRSDQLN